MTHDSNCDARNSAIVTHETVHSDEQDWERIVATAEAVMKESRQVLNGLDKAIRDLAIMLRIIQPYAQGKIDLRYIARRGGGPAEPTFVSWKWTAATRENGRLTKYKIVPTEQVLKYIKRYGPFAGTEEDVRYLLSRLRALMERRKQVADVYRRFKQTMRISMANAKRVHDGIAEDFTTERFRMHARHRARMEVWRQKKAEKMRKKDEEEARYAIPDPADYIDLFEPRQNDDDDEGGALPDSYVDEDGNYVGP